MEMIGYAVLIGIVAVLIALAVMCDQIPRPLGRKSKKKRSEIKDKLNEVGISCPESFWKEHEKSRCNDIGSTRHYVTRKRRSMPATSSKRRSSSHVNQNVHGTGSLHHGGTCGSGSSSSSSSSSSGSCGGGGSDGGGGM